MSTIKKVWITKHDGGMIDISIESKTVEPKGIRVKIQERFGKDFHKVIIGLLDTEDLDMILEAIDSYLIGEEI